MSNLTSPIDYQERDGKYTYRGVAANVTIYKGGMLELNANGYVQPWNPTDNLPFAGIAAEGAIIPISPLPSSLVGTTNGWATVKVQLRGLIRVPYASAAITNIGNLVYTAGDDNTISLLENGAPIGIVQDCTDSAFLWINITGFASSLPQRLDPVGVINVPFNLTTGTAFSGITLPPRAIIIEIVMEFTTPLTGATISLGLCTISNTGGSTTSLVNASASPATGSPGFVDLICYSTVSAASITIGPYLNQGTLVGTGTWGACQKPYCTSQNPTLVQFQTTAAAAASAIVGVFHVIFMVV